MSGKIGEKCCTAILVQKRRYFLKDEFDSIRLSFLFVNRKERAARKHSRKT
ncbi:MAG: hypothetical protein LBH00_05390 [Planctomycetaceae bacterium]|nr:hypothetical protein [Planctomycetaceae bacterium]